jgi:lipopolysaccharide/colanic/teichoic acid biosynthesis glycosyltransferase
MSSVTTKKNAPWVQPLHLASGLTDRFGLCSEPLFNQILIWERKRTERTHRPFLLLLLDIQDMAVNGSGQALRDSMAKALAENMRDIDQRGWYVQDHVMGAIFSELNDHDIIQVRDRVFQKVQSALCMALSPVELDQISMSLHVFPEGIDFGDTSPSPDQVLYPDLHLERRYRKFDLMVKRAVDILGSLLALILLLPVIVAIAVAIKLTSKGPVLYRQERVGQFGRRIAFLKFRSMEENNDPTIHKEYVQKLIANSLGQTAENNIFKIQHDPRVTAVGRFIRRTSLDEIPQFLNVLAGDMSLVGPRPPIPYELENYDTWHRQRVLSMKPGITGLWQVVGRSRTTFDEMVRLDIRYIREWSFWVDIRLILATPWVALTGKGGF